MIMKFGVEVLLVLLSVSVALTTIITYILAVHNDHTSPYFPYISKTGDTPPESCVFSFGLSVSGFIGAIILFTRYKHVRYLYTESVININCLNTFSVILGILSFLGLLMVASFQDTAVIMVHGFGSFTLFFCGLAYGWTQTLISFKIYKIGLSRHVGKGLVIFRLFISITASLSCVTMSVLSFLAYNLERSSDESHIYRVISAVCEWFTAGTFLLYFLTFHPDFMAISLDVRVSARSHHTDIINSSVGEFHSLSL